MSSILDVAARFAQSPFFYYFSGVVLVWLAVQGTKWVAGKIGIRHHALFEGLVGAVAIIYGAILGASAGDMLGLSIFVEMEGIGWFWGAVYGGAFVGGVARFFFEILSILAPDDSRLQKILKLYESEGDNGPG